MNRTLITGATGFVGTALCQTFRERGIAFVAATRHGTKPPLGCVRQVSLGPICHNTDWTDALSGVDAVVHLANKAHVMHDHMSLIESLVQYREVNTAGTLNLAHQAAERGVKRFVFISSIKVCGEGLSGQRNFAYDDSLPPSPKDAYAISKWEAEQGLRLIAGATGLEVVILRPPLVYGPGVGANFFQLMQLVAQRWPLPLGRVENSRSLIYLGNLVDAISASLSHTGAVNKTFLVSDGEDVSTPELIRRISTALNLPARLIGFPPNLIRLAGALLGKSQAVDRLLGSLVVDGSAIRRDLQWTPPFSMRQGLKATADWFNAIHER